ncbi:MAG TPA: 2Fe-2S iron-sulfur cluster-binding protein, partial [Planctomycetota bacterium]|nr:2Fe-2S iron-sulfur cluster-binding protein [Planctomycetota bacterium]
MPQISFTIDGKKVTCEKGTMVLQAALDAGVFVPHYCYHPALSVAGNCRMCMVEVVPKPPPNAPPGWKPPPQKPAIACATEAADGMEVLSDRSSMAKAAREGVLEFLLANHPLDCPVCDQAGECDLQDFSFQYGRATSRFVEQKQVKHTKDFGPEVRLYGNRCINCTRCVRFSQEISGGGEICQVNRGDHNVVDVFPGKAFDNALSGNVVDICPVGALVSKDFLHKARVWQLDATPSVCPHCSTGCSIEVHTRDDEVQRLKPRLNPKVNGFWMCDMGRLGYGYVNDKSRLVRFEKGLTGTGTGTGTVAREPASFQDAVGMVARKLEEAGTGAFAMASAWMTNEELFLLGKLVPRERTALLGRGKWKEQRFFPKWGDSLRNPSLPGQQGRGKLHEDGATFVIEEDRNPNRKGAERILGAEACSEAALEALLGKCERGEVKALLLISGMPEYAPAERLLKALEKVPFVAVADVLPGPLVDRAHVVLPAATFAEKEGTFTNGRGETQRFMFARPAPGMARSELETLHAIALKLGKVTGFAAAD